MSIQEVADERESPVEGGDPTSSSTTSPGYGLGDRLVPYTTNSLILQLLRHLQVGGPGVAPGDEAEGEGGDDEPDHPAADPHQGVGGHHGPLLVGAHDVLGPDVPVGRLKDLSARTEDGSKLGVPGRYGHTWRT